MHLKLKRSSDLLVGIVAVVWAAAITGGMTLLARHQFAPGEPARAISSLPDLRRTSRVLLVFLHPQCPCSRATLHELSIALERSSRPIETDIYFVRPHNEPISWIRGDLWEKAKRVAGARIIVDDDGRAASRWGARTSGELVLYDATVKRILFEGGITDGRGNEGPNPGRDALSAWLAGHRGAASTPVFGCALGI